MRRFVQVAFIGVLAVAASCGGDSPTYGGGGGNGGGGGGGGTGGSTSPSITVGDNFFDPSSTTVPVGTTVTWTWSTNTTHNVTFSDGAAGSGNQSGGTFTRTFGSAGTFSYQCTIHAGMNGTVIVQ